MSEAMMEARQVRFSYVSAQGVAPLVLDGVDLTIEQGSFVAILGHNGSGKSTLAKHMNSILLPTGGKVYVNGMDTSDEALLLQIRQTVGMVFQNPDNQIVANVVEEDVAFAPENLGVEPQEIRRRVDDALKAVGMYEFREHAPHLLSGGQKQRIAIAGVIAMAPQCIVLDEPTAMLDPIGRADVLKTIKTLNRERGVTVVLITHHMDEAAQADRLVVMAKGKVIADGTPKQVFQDVEGLETHLGKPVFNTVKEAIAETGADTSLIFVPPFAVGDSIIEAADAGIKLAVVITEHTPVKDMMFAKAYANKKGMKIIGPNCPGIITADECKLGIMPGFIFKKGNIGVISKSGTLTYEAANQVVLGGYGITTAVGIGGDPIIGLAYKELLAEFEKDEQTKAIVMIGEIGGSLEVEAAKFIKENITKPVVAFIAGATAPKGKRMGHAGAIVGSADESAAAKKEALKSYGVHVVDSPADIGKKIKEILK